VLVGFWLVHHVDAKRGEEGFLGRGSEGERQRGVDGGESFQNVLLLLLLSLFLLSLALLFLLLLLFVLGNPARNANSTMLMHRLQIPHRLPSVHFLFSALGIPASFSCFLEFRRWSRERERALTIIAWMVGGMD
jgi:hypothetical protein